MADRLADPQHLAKARVHPIAILSALRTYRGGKTPPISPHQRLGREARGVPAKLVVVGMTSNRFSVADPTDAGMLDVVGFDASTPPVIADFARA